MQNNGTVGITGPVWVLDRTVSRTADWMQGLNEVTHTVTAVVRWIEFFKHLGTDPGHDAHRAHDICRVSELYSEFWIRRVQWAHTERYYVHGSTLHASREPFGYRVVRILQTHPVSQHTFGRTPWHVDCISPVRGAYERPALYSGHVPGTAPGQKAARKLAFIRSQSGTSTKCVCGIRWLLRV